MDGIKKKANKKRKAKKKPTMEHIDLHASLSDSIFKDSFDKFLGDRGDRRKQLNLKTDVRASFNRDSSFELSTIDTDPTDLPNQPTKTISTICSTPNWKFSNVVRATRNNSTDLFASYGSDECNATDSQSNEPIRLDRGAVRHKTNEEEKLYQSSNVMTTGLGSFVSSKTSFLQKSDETEMSACNGSMSSIQPASANCSSQEESKFFECLRKRSLGRRSENVNFTSEMSSTNDSVDLYENVRAGSIQKSANSIDPLQETHNLFDPIQTKSSIDRSSAENYRFESCIEISSELSTSFVDTALDIKSELSTSLVDTALLTKSDFSTSLVDTALVIKSELNTSLVDTALVIKSELSTSLVDTALLTKSGLSTSFVDTALDIKSELSTSLVDTALLTKSDFSTSLVDTALVIKSELNTSLVDTALVIKSELSTSLVDTALLTKSGLSTSFVDTAIAINLETGNDSSSSSPDGSLKEPSESLSESYSTHAQMMSDAGSCQTTKYLRRLRRTIVAMIAPKSDKLECTSDHTSQNAASTSPESDLCCNDILIDKSLDNLACTISEPDEHSNQQVYDSSGVNSSSSQYAEKLQKSLSNQSNPNINHSVEPAFSDGKGNIIDVVPNQSPKLKRLANEMTSSDCIFNSQFVATRKKSKKNSFRRDATDASIETSTTATNNMSFSPAVLSHRCFSNDSDGQTTNKCETANGIPNENSFGTEAALVDTSTATDLQHDSNGLCVGSFESIVAVEERNELIEKPTDNVSTDFSTSTDNIQTSTPLTSDSKPSPRDNLHDSSSSSPDGSLKEPSESLSESYSTHAQMMSDAGSCQTTKYLRRLRRTIVAMIAPKSDKLECTSDHTSQNAASTSPESDLCCNDILIDKSLDNLACTISEPDEHSNQQVYDSSGVNSSSSQYAEKLQKSLSNQSNPNINHSVEPAFSDGKGNIIDVVPNQSPKLKRLANEMTSSDCIFNSQFVATRKKSKKNSFRRDATDASIETSTTATNNMSFSPAVLSHRCFSNDSDGQTTNKCETANGIPNENSFGTEAALVDTSTATDLQHDSNGLCVGSFESIVAVEERNELIEKPTDNVSTDFSTSTDNIQTSTPLTSDSKPSPRDNLRDISNIINCDNVTKRKRNQVVKGVHLPAIIESSEYDHNEHGVDTGADTSLTKCDDQKTVVSTDLHSVTLTAGKWRRSLSLYRKQSMSVRSAYLLEQTDVESINSLKISLSDESTRQKLRHSVSFNLSRDNFAEFNETSDRRAARRRRTSVVNPTDVGRLTELSFRSTYEARDTILRKCGQSEPLEFEDIYSEGALRQCRKIGEGVYGEVFMNKTDAGRAIVLKIIPIEGSLEVNGEPQKKFDEILSEIVIALQLSSLRNDKEYMTSSFAEVVQVRCVQGRYPNHLIDLWELYRDNYQTENDHPEIFNDDQLYIVFELANGGQDLEAFQFANALQSKSTFQQTALALAIAEQKLQFEHRDLHWGNILLCPTDEKFVHFKFNGNTLQIPTEGVKVTIIDYTLSRMLYEGIVLYNDLSSDDELFTAHGDYQFDIYRLMKSNLGNDWQRFEPFNNILWLHYVADKLINGARYKNTKSRKHRVAIEELMVIRDEITNYKSAVESIL